MIQSAFERPSIGGSNALWMKSIAQLPEKLWQFKFWQYFWLFDSLEHIGTVVPWEEGFSEFFYISCHVLRCTCRMIIILLPLERAKIGQPSRYLQHVDRPSEKILEGFEVKFYLKTMTFRKISTSDLRLRFFGKS